MTDPQTWGKPTLHKWACPGCPATCMTNTAQLKAALEAAQGEIEQWKRVARIEQERADVLFARTQMNNEVFKRQNADLAQARARISEAERMALSIIPDKSAHWLCAPADCNYSRILHALSADGLMP